MFWFEKRYCILVWDASSGIILECLWISWITACVYGIFGLSDIEGSLEVPTTSNISLRTLSWISGYFIMYARLQRSVVEVVSIPATQKSRTDAHKFFMLEYECSWNSEFCLLTPVPEFQFSPFVVSKREQSYPGHSLHHNLWLDLRLPRRWIFDTKNLVLQFRIMSRDLLSPHFS